MSAVPTTTNTLVINTAGSGSYVVGSSSSTVVSVLDNPIHVTSDSSSNTLNVLNTNATVVTGLIGIRGDPGISEDEMVYSKRIDFVTEDTLYKAEALVGSSEVDNVWRIRKILISADGDISELWASGSALFNYSWSNRESYIYS